MIYKNIAIFVVAIFFASSIFSGKVVKKYVTTPEESAQRALVIKEYLAQKELLQKQRDAQEISSDEFDKNLKRLNRKKQTDFARVAFNYGDPQRKEDKKIAAKKQRDTMSEEQKERARQALRASRERHRVSYNARERERQKAAWARLSSLEKKQKREAHIQYARTWYQEKLAGMSPEDLEKERKKRSFAQQQYMLRKKKTLSVSEKKLKHPVIEAQPILSLGDLDPAALLVGAPGGGGARKDIDRLSMISGFIQAHGDQDFDGYISEEHDDFDTWYERRVFYNECDKDDEEE